MNQGILWGVVLGFLTSTGLTTTANAACSVPVFEEANYSQGYFFNKPDAPYSNGWGRSGDDEYAALECNNGFMTSMWDAYDFDEGDWNDNRGFEAYCRMDKMLGRTLSALWLLNYSQDAAHQATNWSDLSGTPIHWAGNYAHLNIDELDGVCVWDGAAMLTVYGPIVDNYTEMHKGGVYGHGIVGRAASVLHESRHAAGKDHDGNDGSPRCVEGGTGCDESFSWDTSAGRADSYEVYFLNDFNNNGTYTTSWHKQMARDWANYVLANRFDNIPSFRL